MITTNIDVIKETMNTDIIKKMTKFHGQKCGIEIHSTEKNFPKQTKEFRKVIEEMYQTHLDKNKDYSPANILIAGEVGILVRVWDKFCRICNLMGISFPALLPQLKDLKQRIMKEDISKSEILDILDEIIEAACFDFSRVKEKEPANEPIDDAWLDMANYSVIAFLKRNNKWGC